jgi:hypothetical protein
MEISAAPMTGEAGLYPGNAVESSTSGVAWAAVLGGAFTAAASSLILLALGSGFGLASVSPWSNVGASVTTFTVITAIWLIIVQWLSSGLGGYLTGRLRTKWAGLHTHEVFFRDTANGFLSWAVAAVIVVAFLASTASSVMNGATQVVAGAAAGGTQGAAQAASRSGGNPADPTGYFVDSLYRSDRPNPDAASQDIRPETARILAMGVRNGDVSAPDKAYLAQLVATRTGLSQADAQKRVDDVIAQEKAAELKAREAADKARKAGAYLSLFIGLSMLIGAFIASAAGALGGRQRDEYA